MIGKGGSAVKLREESIRSIVSELGAKAAGAACRSVAGGMCRRHYEARRRPERRCMVAGCEVVITEPNVRKCAHHRKKTHKCREPGCTVMLTGRAWKCEEHRPRAAGQRICLEDGCSTVITPPARKCDRHRPKKPSPRICGEPGCAAPVKTPASRCFRHRPRKPQPTCQEAGCDRSLEGRAKKCWEHRSGRPAPTVGEIRAQVDAVESSEGGTFMIGFVGEDAEVMRRFAMESFLAEGNAAEDVATVIAMFMSGDLAMRKGQRK